MYKVTVFKDDPILDTLKLKNNMTVLVHVSHWFLFDTCQQISTDTLREDSGIVVHCVAMFIPLLRLPFRHRRHRLGHSSTESSYHEGAA